MEQFNFASDRIIMTRPTADNAIWMLTDKGNSKPPTVNIAKKVIRGRFITNLKCDHKESPDSKCWCSRCAKERLRSNFRTDLLFLSSDLLYDFIRPYEILEWKSKKQSNVVMLDFRLLHPNVKEHLSPDVIKSAENFQNTLECSNISNGASLQNTTASPSRENTGSIQNAIMSPSRENTISATKTSNSILNSMSGHTILKNLEAPLKRRHSISEDPLATTSPDGVNRHCISPSSRSLSLNDGIIGSKSPNINDVSKEETQSKLKRKFFKSENSKHKSLSPKATDHNVSKTLSFSYRNPNESLRQRLNKTITVIKPLNKKTSSNFQAQKILKRSKINLQISRARKEVRKEAKYKEIEKRKKKQKRTIEKQKSRVDTSKYSHKKFRQRHENNEDLNSPLEAIARDVEDRKVALELDVELLQSKENKDLRVAVDEKQKSYQPEKELINSRQMIDQENSSIGYPIEDVKKQFVSPDLLRARKNIFRFMNNYDENRRECFGPVVKLSPENLQVFHKNQIDLKKYLAIGIEEEAQTKAIRELDSQNKQNGIITPRDIALGNVSVDMLLLNNERRNSSDSDSGVDISVEGLITGIDPPKIIANPITCNLCTTNNEHESEDALWQHQKSSHMGKIMAEENVFPITHSEENNYYSIEENVGPDMSKFDKSEKVIDENSNQCPAWVCFECNPPCLLSEEKFNSHAEDFLHFEKVLHYNDIHKANDAIKQHVEDDIIVIE